MTFRIIHNCRWLFWCGGMVVWPFVFFRHAEDAVSARLWRHELEHCYQVYREGRIRFYAKYLWYLLRYGYKKNPYELAANEWETATVTPEEWAWYHSKKVEL